MTTFNPGDRVRLSSAADPYRLRDVGKTEGTVLEHTSFYGANDDNRVPVDWDGGKLVHWNWPAASEIEHVPAAEPAVIDPELRERLIVEILRRSAGEGHPVTTADVLVAARAFEAYILGDTK